MEPIMTGRATVAAAAEAGCEAAPKATNAVQAITNWRTVRFTKSTLHLKSSAHAAEAFLAAIRIRLAYPQEEFAALADRIWRRPCLVVRGYVLFHDKRGRLRNLLFGNCVVHLDRDLVLARLQAGEWHGVLHGELVTVRAQVFRGFLRGKQY